ncbi:hypothetical protein M8J77_024245 [Diaphorina citri]|nr:hypothetical protein M8J77_024245 [Diaphorina citri]
MEEHKDNQQLDKGGHFYDALELSISSNRVSIEQAHNNRVSIEQAHNNRVSIEQAHNNRVSIEQAHNSRVSIEQAHTNRTSGISLEDGKSADVSEIEQLVKNTMEQHTTEQRHSRLSGDSNESEEDRIQSAIKQRGHIITELVETERDYVRDLALVVEGYLGEMRDPNSTIPMPEDLSCGKHKMVFGNIEAIYEWHRDIFLKALERCVEHPEEIGPLFKRYERKLSMYVVYCQNKPVSEHIVSEHIDNYFEDIRIKLGHKLQLNDLLIKPVQRITKYQLLLDVLYKHTERAKISRELESLKQAVNVMHEVPKNADDMMDVARLKGFDGKITAQGKLLMRGPLYCTETSVASSSSSNSRGKELQGKITAQGKLLMRGPLYCTETSVASSSSSNSRGKELQVFLFEQSMIFSEAVGKKTQFTHYEYRYKAHIQVNKMSVEEKVPEELTPAGSGGSRGGLSAYFLLKSIDPKKPALTFLCQAPTEESRSEWLRCLGLILQTQRDFLKAIQSPIAYQKELSKDTHPHPHHYTMPLHLGSSHSGSGPMRRSASDTPPARGEGGEGRKWWETPLPPPPAHSKTLPRPPMPSSPLDFNPATQPVINVHPLSESSVELALLTENLSSIRLCDHESGVWSDARWVISPHNGTIQVDDLAPGHTYTFCINNEYKVLYTVPFETRWQQEQFEHRYEELERLGNGRFCTVRKARDRGTGQLVALKQIPRERQPQQITRAEYNLLSTLMHAHIPTALALFENAPVPGTDTIVMQLVHGESLIQHLCRQSTTTESYICCIIRQLHSALHCLHSQQIAHKDIRPENILMNGAVLKLIDLGSSVSVSTVVLPDLEFASPEMLTCSATAGPSTDMWSLGVLLYILLSGVSPFLDESEEETRAHISVADYSFPPEQCGHISVPARELIGQLLNTHADKRPTAGQLLQVAWFAEASCSEFDTERLLPFSARRKQKFKEIQD